jgi:hypothetical protein
VIRAQAIEEACRRVLSADHDLYVWAKTRRWGVPLPHVLTMPAISVILIRDEFRLIMNGAG